MAIVTLKAGTNFLPHFQPLADLSGVRDTGAGLIWYAGSPEPAVTLLKFETVGGDVDKTTGEPTGTVSSFTVSKRDGTALFTVDHVVLSPLDLMRGASDALFEGIFSQDDEAHGGDKSDYLTGFGGADSLYGAGGRDSLTGGTGSDLVDGGDGFDTASFEGLSGANGAGGDVNLALGRAIFGDDVDVLVGIEDVVGSSFADVITGDHDRNTVSGGAGDDRIFGAGGNDTLCGGDGSDALYGGDGKDALYGDAGDDFLTGDSGHDMLDGGEGNDKLYGGKGNDLLVGGFGDDVLKGALGDDTFEGGLGANDLDGGKGNDLFMIGYDPVAVSTGKTYVRTGKGEDVIALKGGGSQVQVGDFDVKRDGVALDVADPHGVSVEDLILSGALSVSGASGFTVVTYLDSTMALTGVDVASFSVDDISLI